MEKPVRYKLTVRLEIQKEEYNGPIPMDEKTGYWSNSMNERLSINEELPLGSLDFMSAMGILGRLHQAIVDIKPTTE